MNDTTPPQGTPPGNPGATTSGFFTWIRRLGISRSTDRWLGGVAGGLAARAGIDPLIVRGIFIVLAVLGGPGVLLYVIGWLLLPDLGGRIHFEEVMRGRAGAAATITAVVVTFALIVWFASMFFAGFGLTQFGGWVPWGWFGVPGWLSTILTVLVWVGITIAIIVVASQLVLRHGRKVKEGGVDQAAASFAAGVHPGSTTEMGAAHPNAGQGEPWAASASEPGQEPTLGRRIDDWSRRASEGAERFSTRANEWSEQVGRQADEWSVRYAEHHDRTKLGAAHIVITLAVALISAGIAALTLIRLGTSVPVALTGALIAATATLAVSIIIAGVRGRHSGGIGFLAFCGVVALVVTTLLPTGTQFQIFGDQEVGASVPASVLVAGTSEVDLTALSSSGSTHDREVWVAFGNANVTIPDDGSIIVRVRLLAGNVSAPGAHGEIISSGGPLIGRTIEPRPAPSFALRGEVPTVTVTMLGGNVRVREVAAPRHLTEKEVTR